MKNNSITENKMFLQAISGIAISLSMLLGILAVWTIYSSQGFMNYVLLFACMVTTAALLLNTIIATDLWTAHRENADNADNEIRRETIDSVITLRKVS